MGGVQSADFGLSGFRYCPVCVAIRRPIEDHEHPIMAVTVATEDLITSQGRSSGKPMHMDMHCRNPCDIEQDESNKMVDLC